MKPLAIPPEVCGVTGARHIGLAFTRPETDGYYSQALLNS